MSTIYRLGFRDKTEGVHYTRLVRPRLLITWELQVKMSDIADAAERARAIAARLTATLLGGGGGGDQGRIVVLANKNLRICH